MKFANITSMMLAINLVDARADGPEYATASSSAS